VSSNYYQAQIAGGAVSITIDVIVDGEPATEQKPIPDAKIFGLGLRDTAAILLANQEGVTAIPDKNADLTELLTIVSNIANSCATIGNTAASEGAPVNPAEAAKLLQYKAQLDAFKLS